MLEVFIQVALVIVSLAFVVLCTFRRKRGYTTIPDEENVSDKLTRDKEFQRMALKEALCQFFLNLSDKYTFVEQLDDIGCRLGQSWFIVKEDKTDKKLLILNKKSPDCSLSLNSSTIQLLNDLFQPLSKHPYIFPITDIGVLAQKPFVFVVETLQKKGSLKDLIHKRKPKEEWSGKYRVQGKPLNVFEIKTYGKQILEAMLFLHTKGIPTNGHVHSGNIFIVKGICKISGYEQAILGFKSRLYPRLSKLLKKNKYAIDTLCFGHLLYEMSYGQELFDAKPGKLHFEFCSRSPEVGEILKFVFGAEDLPYPDLQDILFHRFFQGGDDRYQVDPDSIYFKPQVTRCILKPFKKYFKKMKRKHRKENEEVGIEIVESPEFIRSRAGSHKSNDEINLTVSYEAATQRVSSEYLDHAKSPPSSPNTPLHPSPPHQSSTQHTKKQVTHAQDTQKPAAPLYGVDALMESIKYAIKIRHDAFEHSDDEGSFGGSSFTSVSPPPSPTAPHSNNRPPLSQKPLAPPKPPVTKIAQSSNDKPSIAKKPSNNNHSNGHAPKKPQAVPKCPPLPPVVQPKPANNDDVHFKPSISGRSALLKAIANGSQLRKTATNDRSSPRL